MGRSKPLSQIKPWSEEKKWEDDIEWLDFPDNKQILVRVVGNAMVLARHWVETQNNKRFPVWCPQFDSEAEEYNAKRPCPMHDDFSEKSQKVIVGNCIVRSLQERGDDNPVRGFMVPHALYDDFLSIGEIIKADPGDLEKGVDLAIKYNSKAVGNKKWGAQRGDSTPLTKAERAYKFYDFDALTPDFTKAEVVAQFAKSMKTAMARHKYYVVQEQRIPDGARDPFKYFRGDEKGKPWHTFPELVDFRNSEASEAASTTYKGKGSAETDKAEEPVDSKKKPVEEEPPPPAKTKAAEEEPPPPAKTKPAAEEEPPPPAKKAAEPEAEGVHPDKSIGSKKDPEHGMVPECFRRYDGKAKCHKCPVRAKCIDLTNEDE